jgi:hypothetical protein
MRRPLSLITLAIIAATGLTAFSSAPAQTQRETPPGEGVICAWAIYSFVSDVAERCPTGASVELKAELARSVERLDAYVRENSDITPAQFEAFKREQANVGRPEAEVCGASVADGLVEGLTHMPVDELRTFIDEAVARPGTPTWGTCL